MLFNWSNRNMRGEVFLYVGDCRTQETVSMFITNNNSKTLIGKFICDTGDTPVKLTDSNVGDYVGKHVQMRSPIMCRYRDGCCLTCLGNLEYFVEYQTSQRLSVVLLPETLSKMGKVDPAKETINIIETMVAHDAASPCPVERPEA